MISKLTKKNPCDNKGFFFMLISIYLPLLLLFAPEFDFCGCAVERSVLPDVLLEAFTVVPALPCLFEDWLTPLSDDCLADGLAEDQDSAVLAAWLLLVDWLTCLFTP